MGSPNTTTRKKRLDLQQDLLLLFLQMSFAIAIYVAVNPHLFDYFNTDESPEPVIGAISAIQARGLIQGLNKLEWQGLKIGQKIHNLDRIFADSGSRVDVRLNEGQGISTLPNSLVYIKKRELNNEIILEGGRAYITLIAGQSLALQNGQFVVAANRSELLLENLQKGFDFQVESGSVQVYNSKTKKWENFINRSTVAQTNNSIHLVAPREKVFLRPGEKLQFAWFWRGSPMNWKVELSKTRDFAKIHSELSTGTSQQILYKVSEGAWYWRVVGQRLFSEKVYRSRPILFDLHYQEGGPERKLASQNPSLDLHRAPYGISFNFIADIGRTMVRWLYDLPSERYHLVVGCKSSNETDLEIYAGQKAAAIDLEPYEGCRMRLRSLWPKSISEWSKNILVPNQPDSKPDHR